MKKLKEKQFPTGMEVLDLEDMRKITGGLSLTLSLSATGAASLFYFTIDPVTAEVKLLTPLVSIQTY